MDLNTVTEVLVARTREDLAAPRAGDAFLAGGTALFGQPADHLRRLVDLTRMGWQPVTVTDAGLEIAATCTVAQLRAIALPPLWRPVGDLIEQCCHAFLASFKIWNRGTVGGNVVMSYPAGPMITLAAATDAVVEVWRPDGTDYRLPVTAFVTGDRTNVLRPGEVLRSVTLSAAALDRRFAARKQALSALGRSSAVIVARSGDPVSLVLTASTARPVVLEVPAGGVPDDLLGRIDAAVGDGWMDDVYGAADWRRHVTGLLAAEVLAELAA